MQKEASICLDFETEAIERRPNYPPRPVGFAIKEPGEKRSTYYAWGHFSANNCTKEKAAQRLKAAWRSGLPILCMNGKFDHDVAETHFGLPSLSWDQRHDVEYLLFLHNPHAVSLALKPSAERILGMKPEERDVLKEWILANVRGVKPSEWGAHICKAPGSLVGEYSNGDVLRTERLFNKLYPEICKRGMQAAYNRERRLMHILLDTERAGIRCDLRAMERDYSMYQQALGTAEQWLRKQLHAPDLNFDADKDVGDVLDREGVITEWTWTKGGHGRAPQRSVSKKNMTLAMFSNSHIAQVYGYRSRLQTCLSMFFEPWLAMARESDGIIFCSWNQVRQSHGNDLVGTRTSRLSSTPNFQNIPRDFEDKDDGYKNPKNFPSLPLMRRYLLPDKDEMWGHRDFSQQELRVLAHFEDGELCKRYCADPTFDIHTAAQEGIRKIAGINLTRSGAKIVVFADIYSRGITQLAITLGVDRKTAQAIRAAKDTLMPGVQVLAREVKLRGATGLPVRTWGGSEIYCDKPAFVKKYGRVMDFSFRLLNHLIQRSSAEITKEVVVRYTDHPKRQARFILTVHDEVNASFPGGRIKEEMGVLREVMEGIELDVPLLSDGKIGKTWGDLKKYED